MKNITIVMLFLTLITTTRSNAITITNESSQSFIIDCHDRSGEHEFHLAPTGIPTQMFDFNFVRAKSTQYIETDAHLLTITIRNPYSPDGRFSHIDNHVQAIINIYNIDQISIVETPDILHSHASCQFLIIKNCEKSQKSPDSGIEQQSSDTVTNPPKSIESHHHSNILGMITQMDLDFSSIAFHKYHPRTELQDFERASSDSAFFE